LFGLLVDIITQILSFTSNPWLLGNQILRFYRTT